MKEFWNLISGDVLELVLTVISVVIARYIIPAIKADLIPWLKEKRLYSTVKKLVQAAEKLAESGVIEKKNKSQYVIDLLLENGIDVNNTVKAFIESSCKEIDIAVGVAKNEILKEEEVE